MCLQKWQPRKKGEGGSGVKSIFFTSRWKFGLFFAHCQFSSQGFKKWTLAGNHQKKYISQYCQSKYLSRRFDKISNSWKLFMPQRKCKFPKCKVFLGINEFLPKKKVLTTETWNLYCKMILENYYGDYVYMFFHN